MQVRNLETGEIETLRHGPATDAVTAGTHEFVNVDVDGEDYEAGKGETPVAPDYDALTKAELLKLARDRGIDIADSATKAEIVAVLRAR